MDHPPASPPDLPPEQDREEARDSRVWLTLAIIGTVSALAVIAYLFAPVVMHR